MEAKTTVGRAVPHIEGRAKVTGEAPYSADIMLPGMLWGKCLRSPLPHARVVSIDTSEAKQLPGIHAVITAADLPDILLGRFLLDCPVLARDRVRFIGEKVVAVAAESLDAAEAALGLIEVEYEEVPAVFDSLEAMREDAPRIHNHPAAYSHAQLFPLHQADSRIGPPIPNVMSQVIYRNGDIYAGFQQASRIFEHSFFVPPVHQGYIEPHACVTSCRPDGGIDFWLSNKTPFIARGQIAAALGISEDRIRVNPVVIGGDFGGKGSLMDAVLCYFLAKSSARPVKMVMSYTEELMAGNPRHDAVVTHRTGVDADGRLIARQAKIIFNCGAYGAFIPLHTVHGGSHAAGGYRVPNLEIEVLRVYTNTVPRGHMRAPGAPQTVFTVESHLDMIAHEIGLDPLEFRLRNVLSETDAGPLGEQWQQIRAKQTLQAAANAAGWNSAKRRFVGRGIGTYDREPGGFGQSSATLTLAINGAVTLVTGAADTGTGFYTVLQQMVAEDLQVPLESVAVVQGSTDTASFEVGAGGSRLTHTAGQAAVAAARELKHALHELAAEYFAIEKAQVRMMLDAFVTNDGRQMRRAALLEWAAARRALPMTRTGTYTPQPPIGVTCFAAQIAEVEIDPDTGQIRLCKLVTAHDVGTVINPLTHQGQIEGGVVQGIGQALTEHLVVRDGAVISLNLGDYKLPTSMDIPELTTVLMESDVGPAPFSGKAIGEMSNVAVPAAIANAVFDAVGVRLINLPITAENIYAGLKARQRVE
jgi:CO/xanthine dehydrogenase Mo-binding subunit